jgi:hypothetical protein
VLFIRARSTIRADGCRPRKFERHISKYPQTPAIVARRPLRAARANPVFDKSNNGLGLPLSKIANCKGVELPFFTKPES